MKDTNQKTKEAKKFRLGGMRGYLTTITSDKEAKYLVALDSKATWTAGTRLVKKNGSLISDDTFGIVKDGLFKYSNNYYTPSLHSYNSTTYVKQVLYPQTLFSYYLHNFAKYQYLQLN